MQFCTRPMLDVDSPLPWKAVKWMKHIFVGLLTALTFLAPQAFANTNCAQLENARERLACYDSQFPPEEGRELPRITSEPIRAPATLGNEPTQSTEQTLASTSTRTRPAPQPGERGGGGAGLFGWTDQIDLDTEIVAVRRGNQQRMVFRLANGQIWMQNNARDLPFSVGDKVTIKNGRIGGYMMRSDAGTSTRVRRIE